MSLIKSIREHHVQNDIRYSLFKMFVIISAILSFLVGCVNVLNVRPLSNILLAYSGTLVCIISYIMAKDPNNYLLARLIFYLYYSCINVPIGYILSPGSYSAMVYMIILITFMTSIVTVNKWEYLFPVLVVVQTPILLRTEIWFPHWYEAYTDTLYRINDLSLNVTIVLLAILGTVYYMMINYKTHNDQLYKVSVTDSLTGLYNRHYFFDFAEMTFNRSLRENRTFSIIFVDLNNFKQINDNLGHMEGDRVLHDIAEIIMNNIRSYDIAARYGGDEFIIILPDTSVQDAEHQMNRLKEAFDHYSEDYAQYQFSVGYGLADNTGKTFEEIIALADQRLYENKHKRKSGL